MFATYLLTLLARVIYRHTLRPLYLWLYPTSKVAARAWSAR